MHRENFPKEEITINTERENKLPPAVKAVMEVIPTAHKNTFLALFSSGALPNIDRINNSATTDFGSMGERARQFFTGLEKWGLTATLGIFGIAAGWYLPSIILPKHEKLRYVSRVLLWYMTYQVALTAHQQGSNFIPHLLNLLSN